MKHVQPPAVAGLAVLRPRPRQPGEELRGSSFDDGIATAAVRNTPDGRLNAVLSNNPIDAITECLFLVEGWISDLAAVGKPMNR